MNTGIFPTLPDYFFLPLKKAWGKFLVSYHEIQGTGKMTGGTEPVFYLQSYQMPTGHEWIPARIETIK